MKEDNIIAKGYQSLIIYKKDDNESISRKLPQGQKQTKKKTK